jgi:hypothetical protein
MGQGHSQSAEVRPATPEAELSLEERARIQAEVSHSCLLLLFASCSTLRSCPLPDHPLIAEY